MEETPVQSVCWVHKCFRGVSNPSVLLVTAIHLWFDSLWVPVFTWRLLVMDGWRRAAALAPFKGSPFSLSSVSLVLSWGWLCPWKTFSSVWSHFRLSLLGGGCFWHLACRGQGCWTSYNAQDRPPQQGIIMPQMSIVRGGETLWCYFHSFFLILLKYGWFAMLW